MVYSVFLLFSSFFTFNWCCAFLCVVLFLLCCFIFPDSPLYQVLREICELTTSLREPAPSGPQTLLTHRLRNVCGELGIAGELDFKDVSGPFPPRPWSSIVAVGFSGEAWLARLMGSSPYRTSVQGFPSSAGVSGSWRGSWMRSWGAKEAHRFLFFPLASQVHWQVCLVSMGNDGIDGKNTIFLSRNEKENILH